MAPTSIIRIFKLWDPQHSGDVGCVALQLLPHVDLLLCLGPVQHEVHNAALHHLLDGGLRQLAGGPKSCRLRRESVLGLRIKGRILNQRVDKDPQVRPNMVGLDLHTSLVLLVHPLRNGSDELVCDVVDMRAAFGGVDAVHEGDLLEGAIGQRDAYVPSFVTLLPNLHSVRSPGQIQIDVVTEISDTKRRTIEMHLAPLVC
mmetsp:Transcript_28513/g.68590  ORF Transcript_28513/g.68590 Transcript_28513/m.68590 type:complete len:201 (-) Transcript_28513:738-1340(-)